MLATLEANQRLMSGSAEALKKAQLGQFFTPRRIAGFMASLFSDTGGDCRLLDAGAGVGSLTAAFLERWVAGHLRFSSVEAVAFEIDTTLHRRLRDALAEYAARDNLTPGKPWSQAENPLVGITPIMDWARKHYRRKYAPNTRETFSTASVSWDHISRRAEHAAPPAEDAT